MMVMEDCAVVSHQPWRLSKYCLGHVDDFEKSLEYDGGHMMIKVNLDVLSDRPESATPKNVPRA